MMGRIYNKPMKISIDEDLVHVSSESGFEAWMRPDQARKFAAALVEYASYLDPDHDVSARMIAGMSEAGRRT